ncbi:adenine deaminase [Halorientalis pallida]|uniref:Adenine deaminase n=1 Tax=Halorientalis pallida TaxID=2479928 RepID=A0A498KUI1_9EURY|nr:adenine deaminase C-terminal domain-containing protein [Halorientalis pallida]RXK47975.1 adenine deaminase [Halorientalis pallida]
MARTDTIDVALGEQPADLVVTDAEVIDVHTREIRSGGVAVVGDRIAYVGAEASEMIGEETTVLDADGRYLSPGFIDAHIHVESTLLTPTEFTKAVLQHGTTAVATDLMEVTIVSGVDGLEEILDECRQLPLGFFYMVPSFMEEGDVQTVGGKLEPELVNELIDLPEAMGLAEVLVPPVLDENPVVTEMIETAIEKNKTREGHSPDTYGRELQAYVGAGATSDHESTNVDEALGKLRAGQWVYMREGSASTDLESVVEMVTERDIDTRRVGMISDDIDALHIDEKGHMDHKIRLAVDAGVDPVEAIQMATINPAEGMRIDEDYGSIAPGKFADLVLLEGELADCAVSSVVAKGELLYDSGELTGELPSVDYSETLRDTVDVGGELHPDEFTVTVDESATEARVNVLGASGSTLLKEAQEATLPVVDSVVRADPDDDVLHIASVDRYEASGRVGTGFVSGFGLDTGAFATSVGHDHHNVTVVGASPDEMAVAANRVAELEGGLVVVRDGEVAAELRLPVCGLLSPEPIDAVTDRLDEMNRLLDEMGCEMASPFMSLSFVTLIYIPAYGITDYGLVEADGFDVVDPVVETT